MNATAEAPKMPPEFRFMCNMFHLGLILQAPRDHKKALFTTDSSIAKVVQGVQLSSWDQCPLNPGDVFHLRRKRLGVPSCGGVGSIVS